MRKIELDGAALDLESISDVAKGRASVLLPASTIARIEAGAQFVASVVAEKRRSYGINTGFGALSSVTIAPSDLGKLQLNLLRSHAAGVGPPFGDEAVRAMLLLRANTLARGHSGVRPVVVERLVASLEAGLHPIVPCQGSVGASGDLAPLAHLALSLVGEGRVRLDGVEVATTDALEKLGWEPLTLGPKEGLALINGTQTSTAVGALALLEAQSLLRHADVIAAVSIEAMNGRPGAFDERVHALRPIPGQVASAANLRRLLADSSLTITEDESHQDAYSLRCVPQVHGAAREMVGLAVRIVEIEANAVTDNPIVFPEDDDVISAGNFHGEPIAQCLDAAGIGVASLGSISERRLDRLISGASDGLPKFLIDDAGLQSGFMMVHVTAASLVAENKLHASPASVDNIPTSAGKEDHVSFSTHAARKLATIVGNVTNVLAAELIAACQALDYRDLAAASTAARTVHRLVRADIPKLTTDRIMHIDLEKAAALIRSNRCLDAIADIE